MSRNVMSGHAWVLRNLDNKKKITIGGRDRQQPTVGDTFCFCVPQRFVICVQGRDIP